MNALASMPPNAAAEPTLDARPLGPDDLRDLMKAVMDTTQRLHATHEALQTQVAQLKRELAEANQQLDRSRTLAALGEMAAGIAHEVRNPLGSIQLYVQMLAEDVADQPPQVELCAKVIRAINGLDAIVRDVLAFARDSTPSASSTSAEDLMNRALAACEGAAAQRGVKLCVLSNAHLPLTADVGLLTQALTNLVRNAIEACEVRPAGAPAEVRLAAALRSVRCPDGVVRPRIVIRVEDDGPGIAPEARERLFRPFFTTRAAGTGLGLAIVHRIVDAHGGHIVVDAPGPREGGGLGRRGARFDVCLPLEPERQAVEQADGATVRRARADVEIDLKTPCGV